VKLQTLNTAEVHGWRRVLYWFIWGASIFLFMGGIAVVSTGVQILFAFCSEAWNGRSMLDPPSKWGEHAGLTGSGVLLAGLVAIAAGSFFFGKFKREGAEEIFPLGKN
jgi:hypothetical protein